MPINYINVRTGKNADLLPEPGTYAVVSYNKSDKEIRIGKLGKLLFKKGYYIYTGSARGMGGLRARITRHLKKGKSRHWHIDFLRESIDFKEIWYCYGNDKMECNWAAILKNIKGCEYPVKGFGSSDCRCCSHLIYTKKRPLLNKLLE